MPRCAAPTDRFQNQSSHGECVDVTYRCDAEGTVFDAEGTLRCPDHAGPVAEPAIPEGVRFVASGDAILIAAGAEGRIILGASALVFPEPATLDYAEAVDVASQLLKAALAPADWLLVRAAISVCDWRQSMADAAVTE